MPIAKVQLPDGRIGRFEVPEGTTPEQVSDFVSKGLPNAQAPSGSSWYADTLKQSAFDVAKGLVTGGVPGAIAGAGKGMNNAMDQAAYRAGGAVTDLTGSPAAGLAANVGIQAIPAVVGGEAAKVAAPLAAGAGRWVMQTAVKPSVASLLSGDAAKGIETMLQNGISATKGGVMKMHALADQLSEQVKQTIANSSMTVNKGDVGKRLLDTLDTFRKQVNPQADMEAVRQAWLNFRNHPDLIGQQQIPIQLAQDMKQGTYTQLAKKYGEMGSADTEAQKALARGLKEEIARAEPGVAKPNELQSQLRNAIEVSERRALVQSNNNPGGLVWMAHDPVAAAGFLADKSAWLKSLLARALYSGQEQIPALGGRGVGALYGANQGQPGALYQQ